MSTFNQCQQAYDAQYDVASERADILEAKTETLAKSLAFEYSRDVDHLSDSFGDICNDAEFLANYASWRLATCERKNELGLMILEQMSSITDAYLLFIATQDAEEELK